MRIIGTCFNGDVFGRISPKEFKILCSIHQLAREAGIIDTPKEEEEICRSGREQHNIITTPGHNTDKNWNMESTLRIAEEQLKKAIQEKP